MCYTISTTCYLTLNFIASSCNPFRRTNISYSPSSHCKSFRHTIYSYCSIFYCIISSNTIVTTFIIYMFIYFIRNYKDVFIILKYFWKCWKFFVRINRSTRITWRTEPYHFCFFSNGTFKLCTSHFKIVFNIGFYFNRNTSFQFYNIRITNPVWTW